ncbi:MAG: endonuclease, partial [Ramlibacter sp.]|nr:endonuclease [Ramlibacter sp.]
MPEGPSIVILKEEANRFLGKSIVRVEGNTTIDKERLLNQRIEALRSWGKHFLIELPDFSVRVHFLLFGSYRINERKEAPPRLSLGFDTGELNFY